MPEEWSDDDRNDPESDVEEEEECDPAEIENSRNEALIEFRCKVEEAIRGEYLIAEKGNSDLTLWGVPLLPSSSHGSTDAVLIKFLRAKHYKVGEAFKMLRKTLKWRADFQPEKGIDGPDFDNLWFASGRDKEGRPLCYSVVGEEFQKKLLNPVEKYQDYFRWRVLCVEKGIQNLSFGPGGVDSFIQIFDLRNASGIAMKEVKLICKRMMHLLNDHYPGIVYKNLIINVPSWFLTLNALNLRIITQRSKNKFIFVRPSRITRSLLQLKYTTVENILKQYGGLKRENDLEFSTKDKVREVNIRANAKDCIEIHVNESGVTVTWDLTVVGHEVAYREEFVPDDDCSYKILLQEKKMVESIRNSFYIRETGKIVITIVNGSYTKKKAFYRYKSRPFVPMYVLIK